MFALILFGIASGRQCVDNGITQVFENEIDIVDKFDMTNVYSNLVAKDMVGKWYCAKVKDADLFVVVTLQGWNSTHIVKFATGNLGHIINDEINCHDKVAINKEDIEIWNVDFQKLIYVREENISLFDHVNALYVMKMYMRHIDRLVVVDKHGYFYCAVMSDYYFDNIEVSFNGWSSEWDEIITKDESRIGTIKSI